MKKNFIEDRIKQEESRSRRKKRRHRILCLLSAMVLLFTSAFFVLPANTATAQLTCGKEEHVHTDACYQVEKQLVCGKTEHTHTADCYDENGNLICGQEEHTHTDACYQEVKTLVCGKEEHVHTADCYEKAGKLTAAASDGMQAEVSYEAGVLHEGTAMDAQLLKGTQADNVKSLIEQKLSQDGIEKEIAACYPYDISFTSKEGTQVEPDGDVDVTLTFGTPKTAEGSDRTDRTNGAETSSEDITWKVYHIDDNNNAADLDDSSQNAGLQVEQRDGAVTKVTFQASSFSPYVLVALTDPSKDGSASSDDAAYQDQEESGTAGDNDAVQPSGSQDETAGDADSQQAAAQEGQSDTASQDISASEGTSSASSDASSAEEGGQAESRILSQAENGISHEASVQIAKTAIFSLSTASLDEQDGLAGLMAAAVAAGATVDLSKYITAVESYKYENGRWVSTTEFTNGDTAKFQFSYFVPSGDLSDSDATLSYKLGDGVIVPSSGQSGDIMDASENDVGDYTISTDGTITMTFNDNLDTTVAFTGEIIFEGTVKNSSDTDTVTHKFSDGTTITVKPSEKEKTTDLSVSKKGELGSDGLVHYTITVSTTKGTGDKVTVSDNLQGSGMSGSLSYSNISIKDGNGNTVTPVSGSTFPFILPKMSANSQYVITYTVKPGTADSKTGESFIRNTAEAYSGDDHDSNSTQTMVTHKMLDKYWWGGSGKYNWTITINPDRTNISGYILQDKFTAQTGGDPISLPSTVTVTNQDGKSKQVSFKNGEITFPISGFSSTDTYTITYQTDIPTGTEGSSYTSTNEAKFSKGSKIYSADSSASYTVPEKKYDVQKWSITDDYGSLTGAGSAEVKDGYNLLTWVARIDLPSKVISSEDMTFEDFLQDENGSQDASIHYTTAKLLNDTSQTYLWSEDGTTLEPGKDYRIYAGNTDITGSSSKDKITDFKFVFTDDYVKNRLNGQTSISLHYQSMVATDGLHVGNSRKVTNKALVQGQSSTGEYVYKVDGDVDKQSSASKDGPYSSGNVKVDLASGKIYYRLLVKVNKDNGTAITIKDTMQDGLTVDPDSISAKYYGGDPDYNTGYTKDPWNNNSSHPAGDLTDSSIFSAQVSSDGKTLTASLPAGKYANEFQYLVIYYAANIDQSENSVWNDKTVKKKVFSNKATWEEKGASDTQDTEVDKKAKTVEKTVTQLKDGKGNVTNNLEYQIVVNPEAEDLVEGSDTIHLADKVTGVTESAYIHLIPEKTVVYQYSETAENHRGSVMNAQRYSYTYDESSHQLDFELPDETAMVVCYTYHVQPGVNMPTITNEASIEGVSGSGSKVSQQLEKSSSSSSATQSVLYLYKVDADNYGIFLPNVEFKLQVYDPSKVQWNSGADDGWSDVSTVTTGDGSNGSILGGVKFAEGDTGSPEKGKLYRLVETNNPNSGYGSSENYSTIYFVWMNRSGNNSNKGDIWSNVGGYYQLGITNKGLTQDSVQWVYDDNSIYATNPYEAIQVRKVWLDQNNQEMDNPGKTVTVHLHRQIGDYVHNHVAVDLTDSNGNAKSYEADVEPGTPVTVTIWSSNSNITYNGTTYSGTWDAEKGSTKFIISLGNIQSDGSYDIDVGYVPNVKDVQLDYTKPTQMNVTEDTVIDTQTLSTANQWKYVWDGTTKDANGNTVSLPETDGKGNTYKYYIEEDPVAGYTTSYSNGSEAVQSGKITVTNKKKESSGYELPETGGKGPVRYLFAGTLLMGASALLLLSRRKRRRGG